MTGSTFHARTSARYGPGAFRELGGAARELGFRRTLLVADPGMIRAGYAPRAQRMLAEAGIECHCFDGFGDNPTTGHVEAGRIAAEAFRPDSLIGLGGGSSMDCAKAINFVATNGGTIRDYWGYGKAAQPMLPMIGVPTTTGTGSEAQSYALISDHETHVKMACGAPGAAFRLVVLDPELAVSQPPWLLATAGYDAISHAVETFVTSARNHVSECFARESWRLLNANFERLLRTPGDVEAAGHMQMGAYFAGCAIENSMLGAAHATANPLTARFRITHGAAIALMLDHVVAWNAAFANERYRQLHADLVRRLDELAVEASLSRSLRDAGVPREVLPELADDASKQWTGKFNPRPFDKAAALEIYEWAY